METEIETSLALDGSLNLKSINSLIHYYLQSMCFLESERQSINKASEILASDFLNIINTYFEISDKVTGDQYPVSIKVVVEGFLSNLKMQVLKHLNNRLVSSGLLFTWIPIVMLLNRSAKETNAFKFLYATTHLELEVHKFALPYLSLTLKNQCKNLNGEGSFDANKSKLVRQLIN